jgi:hypothetical protein
MTATALAAVGSNANENGTLLISGTAVTASGTSVDFTGIPSWAKRITVMLSGVSTNGTSNPIIQLGDSGGVEASGYSAVAMYSSGDTTYTTGFGIASGLAANSIVGSAVISLVDASTNTWVVQGCFYYSSVGNLMAGGKSLSATLDRVRITTVNGTDTFDAGTINIMWE